MKIEIGDISYMHMYVQVTSGHVADAALFEKLLSDDCSTHYSSQNSVQEDMNIYWL